MTKKFNLILILSVILYSMVAFLSLSPSISAENFRGSDVNDIITGTRSQDTINAAGW